MKIEFSRQILEKSPLQQLLHERAPKLRYTNIACVGLVGSMQAASTSGRFTPAKNSPDTQLILVLVGLRKFLGFLGINRDFLHGVKTQTLQPMKR